MTYHIKHADGSLARDYEGNVHTVSDDMKQAYEAFNEQFTPNPLGRLTFVEIEGENE